MNREFNLTLLGGQMRLTETGSGQSLLSGPASAEYDLAQAAVERALTIIAEATGRMHGDQVDETGLKDALIKGSFKLVLHGHSRELHVAALHLHVRYDLDFDSILDGALPGIRLTPIPDAVDNYGTYRFESDMRPLEAMRELFDQWLKVADRDPKAKGNAQRNHPQWKQLLALGGNDRAPLRVVVTGVTGAGKSTFLNALLGRDIVPHSSGVCTAAILRIRYAPSPQAEEVRVHWLPVEEISSLAKEFTAKAEALTPRNAREGGAAVGSKPSEEVTQRRDYYEAKARAMRNAGAQRGKGAVTRVQIKDLHQYARNDAQSFAEATQELQVFISHPLLRHLEIVDAPGLRDGNEERQKMLRKAFEGDTAWLYLVPADARNESCKADWELIREKAGNGLGVLVLTKADGQPANDGETIDETMKKRLTIDYKGTFGWLDPMVWCSALMPSRFATMQGEWTERALDSVFTESRLPSILGLPNRAAKIRLENFLHDASRDTNRKQVVTDYVLDASRLPQVMRTVGRVLYQDAISKKVRRGRDELAAAASEALQACDDGLQESKRVLEAHDAIAALLVQVEQRQERIRVLQADYKQLSDRHRVSLNSVRTQCADANADFRREADGLIARLKGIFDGVFRNQSKNIYMSGGRSFSLLDHFESPLSVFARRRLQALSVAIANQISAYSPRSLASEELRPERVVLVSIGVPTVTDREGFWELKETAQARMWESTALRALSCRDELNRNFQLEVQKIEGFASSLIREDETKKKSAIQTLEAKLAATQQEIKDNDPKQSLQTARERMTAYIEHRKAFEGFMASLKAEESQG